MRRPGLPLVCLVLGFLESLAWRLDNKRNTFFRDGLSTKLRGGANADLDGVVKVAPFIDEPPISAHKKKALVLLDAFAPYHGLYLAHRAKQVYGVAIVPVLSDYMKGYFMLRPPEDLERLLSMCMPTEDQKDDWLKPLEDFELVTILCESDSGLADSERLGELLNVTYHNGMNEARRNKFLMLEELSKAGLPVVKQKPCRSEEEACDFAKELGIGDSFVVVKPNRGVGSEDVYLCKDMESVKSAFQCIHGEVVFGSPKEKHEVVLVQEFAEGKEFAIDVVSKDGEHKVAAIWEYDKRPANGASFVYFATKIYDGEHTPELCGYVRSSLDALGIRWGLTHNEVILTVNGPRLVEVNCRQHNMDFTPLTMGSIGYNAFDMLLAAYLGEEDPSIYPVEAATERLDWDLLPPNPTTRMKGSMIHLVNYANGTLSYFNEEALMEIQKLPSVLAMEVYPPFVHVGSRVRPTVDIRSDVSTLHSNKEFCSLFKF